MRRLLLITGFLMAVFMAVSAFAQEAANPPMSGKSMQEMGKAMMGASGVQEMLGVDVGKLGNADFFLEHSSNLNLTDSQVSRLKTVQQEHSQSLETPAKKLQILEDELQTLITAETPDMTKIKVKIREVQEARTNRLISEIDYASQSRDILNENQRGLAIDLSSEQRMMPSLPSGVPVAPRPEGGM